MSFSHRPATPDDARAVAGLISAFDAVHHGELNGLSEQDVLDWWKGLAPDGVIVVADENGEMIGVGTVRERGDNYVSDNFVHPDFQRRGVGAFLVGWAERRAAEAGAVSVRVGVAALDARAKELVESRGFGYIRSFYRMAIEFDEPPPPPCWPTGFVVETMRAGEERLVYDVVDEAFQDHWGYVSRSFEEWMARVRFDADLCFLIRADDGTVVAAEFCNEERFGVGWVDVLGVRRDWRRRGLGEALLQLAFRELYDRGQRRVGLGVDAENSTGATHLYERVGMKPSSQDDVYEKPL